jgi:hypothetical protein
MLYINMFCGYNCTFSYEFVCRFFANGAVYWVTVSMEHVDTDVQRHSFAEGKGHNVIPKHPKHTHKLHVALYRQARYII